MAPSAAKRTHVFGVEAVRITPRLLEAPAARTLNRPGAVLVRISRLILNARDAVVEVGENLREVLPLVSRDSGRRSEEPTSSAEFGRRAGNTSAERNPKFSDRTSSELCPTLLLEGVVDHTHRGLKRIRRAAPGQQVERSGTLPRIAQRRDFAKSRYRWGGARRTPTRYRRYFSANTFRGGAQRCRTRGTSHDRAV